MSATSHTPAGIYYDRAGDRGDTPVVLLHAGVADRRMWNALWPALVASHDVVRLDFRGFGQSSARPSGPLSPVDDVLDTLDALDIGPCHLVGASFGAGVAVEAALVRPELVDSLLLSAPGGSLIADATPQLREFIEAENTALAQGDLDAAVEANVAWWVDGPDRNADEVAPAIRDLVRQMQRRAFEVTEGWDDVSTRELEPAALDRLAEVRARTLVVLGELDIDAVHEAARYVTDGIAGARLVTWPGVAHLPSMERPDVFLALLGDWLAAEH